MASYTAQGAPEPKKACKGILKTSSSFDKHNFACNRKSAKFDELNVLQTYHPPDKDYGHMKIEEPKTPYRVSNDDDSLDQLDANLLAEKLEMVTSSPDNESSEDENETDDQRIKRLEFEKRRKLHYNEFDAIRRARQLMEEEDEDDEDDKNDNADNDNKLIDEKNICVRASDSDNSLLHKIDNDEQRMDIDDVTSSSVHNATTTITPAATSTSVASTSSST